MTFFYDLNKKLKEVLEAPKSVNQQLNERDEGKHNNATTGFKALADKAAKEYGSKAAGERVAGAVRNKMKKAGKLEENDMEESAFQAAIGKKKYGADGMKALQKAGREHASAKTMSNIRNKYDKYDESMEEGMFDSLKQGMKKVAKKGIETLGHGSDEDLRKDLQRKMGLPPTGKKPAKPMGEEYGPLESAGAAPIDYDKVLEAIAALYGDDIWDNDAMQDLANDLEQAGPTDKELDFIIARGKLPKRLAGIQFSAGDDVQFGESGGTPMTPKQKKFAKLAPPADKITFADKIAGAKKEVDEMLGDVAANAMRKAVKGKKVADEGSDWSQLGKEYSRPKIGSIEHGHKHDIEHTVTGRKVTRRTDDQGMSVGADDDTEGQPVKKGRGRPKGTGKSIGAKGPSGKSKLIQKGAQAPKKKNEEEELDEKAVSKKQQKFMGMVHAAQKGEKPASKEVAKVAKSMKKKDAEDFASTKHKGLPEKKKKKTEEAGGSGTPTASSGFSFGKGIYDSLNREIENLISESMSMNASDSTDGTKSLTITATDEDALKLADIMRNAGLGGGAEHSHDEMTHSHEGGEEPHEHGEIEIVGTQSPISGDEGGCPTCGSHDCGCGDIEEALAENEPDWPTDEVESDDALQYSGGLNGPKSTGQTTVPVIAHQGDRTGVDDEELRRLREMAGIVSEQEQVMAPESVEEAKEEELDEAAEELDESKCNECGMYEADCKCSESVEESLARFRSLAGLKEAAKPDYIDLDKDGDKEESMKKAADDKEKEKKVEESIFRMSNLWKAYKG